MITLQEIETGSIIQVHPVDAAEILKHGGYRKEIQVILYDPMPNHIFAGELPEMTLRVSPELIAAGPVHADGIAASVLPEVQAITEARRGRGRPPKVRS